MQTTRFQCILSTKSLPLFLFFFLQRFFASAPPPSFTKRRFQLAAMASFQLAAKISEAGVPSMRTMAALSKGLFTPDMISKTQSEIL